MRPPFHYPPASPIALYHPCGFSPNPIHNLFFTSASLFFLASFASSAGAGAVDVEAEGSIFIESSSVTNPGTGTAGCQDGRAQARITVGIAAAALDRKSVV